MTTGIYKITNLVNGKVYIGASKNIERRWSSHKRSVKSPIHSDLEALGVENFKFEVLIECPEDMLCQWERDMICLYDADDPEKGYNDKDGRPYSLSISKTLKGRVVWNKGIKTNRPAWNKGIKTNRPAWNRGIPHSDESKRKISEASKGRKRTPFSEEHKRKLSEALKGHIVSDESKRRMSESHKGRPANNRGIPHSDESKRKISEANKGRKRTPFSEEHKRKLSESHKEYWRKKKEV